MMVFDVGGFDMLIDKLHELHRAEPFRPIIIHLSDGRRIRVGNPEWMAFWPESPRVLISNRDGSTTEFDSRLMTNLEVKSNAKKKRARAA
jgi:hypothetical protein